MCVCWGLTEVLDLVHITEYCHASNTLLDDSSESTWDNWLEKMCIKLSVNQDYFSEKADWMKYILSWLSDKAAQHTESHLLYESSVIDSFRMLMRFWRI